jgi:aminoglycoside phosphotransferase (APT) family kinase protein
MDALTLVATIAPRASVREVSTSPGPKSNRVFRLLEEGGRATVVKIYASAGRERRERHALEALAGVEGVPEIIDRGVTSDGTAWAQLTDGGGWSLKSLTKNHEVLQKAGRIVRLVHDSKGEITNLEGGMDGDYVASHYQSTIDRLGRYRRKLQIPPEVLEAATNAPAPVSGDPVPTHTHPTADKFLVSEAGEVMLVDWEWATLAPPEWDVSLAVWSIGGVHGEDAAAAFLEGYGGDIPRGRLDSWTAYHAAVTLLDMGESREGRLNVSAIVDDLSRAVGVS